MLTVFMLPRSQSSVLKETISFLILLSGSPFDSTLIHSPLYSIRDPLAQSQLIRSTISVTLALS